MWAGEPKNQYSQMVYENGEPCWQGGSRTATVSTTFALQTYGTYECRQSAAKIKTKADEHIKRPTRQQNDREKNR